jgi:hypothetical protein
MQASVTFDLDLELRRARFVSLALTIEEERRGLVAAG